MKTVTCEVKKMTKERKRKTNFWISWWLQSFFWKGGDEKKKNTNKMTGNGVKDETDNLNVSELNKGKY